MSVTVRVWNDDEQRAIREQVARILGSAVFAQSQRRKQLLSYIVDEMIAGRGARLKGYTLAIEVFNREATFDPATDPTIRIEASRLRDKLRSYYATEGTRDPIRIDIPKGGYAPLIELLPVVETGTASASFQPQPMIGPSIAVLPFVNMSAKRTDDYLCDAVTENIITALARFRDLAVAASRSVFAYKGTRGKIADAARELGVKYILEGSVQKAKDRVTITAQLIHGTTGAHVWAERFDRPYDDLMSVVDGVTEQIAGRLGSPYCGRVSKAWRGQADNSSLVKLQAYDHFLAGLDIFDDWAPGCMPKAREHFFKAIDRDPAFGKAYAKIAFSHTIDAWLGWSDDPAQSLAEAGKYAAQAIIRDDDEAWGHWALGYYCLFVGQHERAIAEYRRALQLNPSDPDIMNDFGLCLSLSGRSSEAVGAVHAAMQLNPNYPDWWLAAVGQVYFDARRYQDAVAALERAHTADMTVIHLFLAASYAATGETERAKISIGRARVLDPNVTLSRIALGFLDVYKEPPDREHLRSRLVEAGLF